MSCATSRLLFMLLILNVLCSTWNMSGVSCHRSECKYVNHLFFYMQSYEKVLTLPTFSVLYVNTLPLIYVNTSSLLFAIFLPPLLRLLFAVGLRPPARRASRCRYAPCRASRFALALFALRAVALRPGYIPIKKGGHFCPPLSPPACPFIQPPSRGIDQYK